MRIKKTCSATQAQYEVVHFSVALSTALAEQAPPNADKTSGLGLVHSQAFGTHGSSVSGNFDTI
jgi:hypothetical protein